MIRPSAALVRPPLLAESTAITVSGVIPNCAATLPTNPPKLFQVRARIAALLSDCCGISLSGTRVAFMRSGWLARYPDATVIAAEGDPLVDVVVVVEVVVGVVVVGVVEVGLIVTYCDDTY